MSESNGWLSELKAGDFVIVSGGGNDPIRYVKRVEKVTKTQLVVDGTRFSRRGGIHRFSAWRSIWLEPATKEARDEVAREHWRRRTVTKLYAMNWRKCSDETLRAALNALSTEQQSGAPEGTPG